MCEIRIGASEILAVAVRRPGWLRARGRVVAGAAAGRLEVGLRAAALLRMDRQARASRDEVGGALIGEVALWRARFHVEITSALEAELAPAGPAHITFTAATWSNLHRRLGREHPGATIVGWYHSHPGMEVSMSLPDLAVHREFFPQPWHIALVIDGQAARLGLFGWRDGLVQPLDHLHWLADRRRLRGDPPRAGAASFSYSLGARPRPLQPPPARPS